MKYKTYFACTTLALLCCACQKHKKEDDVISQRYIHKYGYAVSKEEWDENHYPGQIVTSLKNGVTMTASYENGYLHGPCTYSYPDSQTIENYSLYNQGALVKEAHYDVHGLPVRERVQLSPSRYTITLWYAEGSPLSIEEYAHEELLEGQYFTTTNEIEGRVEKGTGLRVRRTAQGVLVSKDSFEQGYMTRKESFYTNGNPESIVHYSRTLLHGERKTFAPTGEPIAIEEYINGKLHGKATYFKNGIRCVEISYLDGMKNGPEIHFIDGEIVSQELNWEDDQKHGPAVYYIDGSRHTQWYYAGQQVSKSRFEELTHLDDMISQISPDVTLYNAR